jgi:phosphoesterase RecJ-like protein
VNSDGDGIGCELALLRALESLGIEARAINSTLVPRSLAFLQRRPAEVALYDAARDSAFLRSADMLVVLDVGLAYRLGCLEGPFRESHAVKLCVDHHLEVDPLFDVVLSDPDLNATGELLYPLIRALGVPILEEIATPLYASISVDSGNFSYERCTPETFRAAADLVAAGARPYPLHVNLRWRRSLDEVRMEGEIIGRLALDESGLVAWSSAPAQVLDRHGVDPMEMPEWVNIPLSLEGVEVALLFVELEPGLVRVSARGKGRVKVSELARAFGGGGHPLAAGFSVRGTLEDARRAVVPAARRMLGLPEGNGSSGGPD